MSPGYDESLNYANLFNYKDSSQDLTSLNFPSPISNQFPPNLSSFLGAKQGVELSDDSDDSDDVLKYISQMLMEEDMEQKPCMFHDTLALQVTEKPFYDALGEKYPPSPNQHPLIDHVVGSPDDHHWSSPPSDSSVSTCSSTLSSTYSMDTKMAVDLSDNNKPLVAEGPSIRSYSQPSTLPQWSFGSSSSSDGTTLNGSMMSSLGFPLNMGVFSEEESIIQFQKGMEEASKFLPKNNNFVIDLENIDFPNETKDDASVVVVKEEKGDNLPDMSRGSKVHYRGDDDANEDFEEGRSSKQSAVSVEEAELSEMFDRVLLCSNKPNDCTFNTNSEKSLLSHGSQSQGQERGKGRPRKQGNSNNVVDLRTLLILCAQSVASDDRRNADELLKQIREHSSSRGDGSQRLAYYFANALEARLSGTGSQLYTALRSKRTSAADMLKAYQFFIRTCPLKKISIGFANYMISEKVAEKASKLHVIDFGIRYGFQWPALIQRLSARDGGPPKLCITGIDLPQPGFRPAERVEATGRRLAKYCERFSVPFEYHAIAQKWETIRVEDLKIGSDEVVAVNCLYRFRNLLDETIMADSPRNAVLNLVRKIKPNIFVHGVVNGSYNAPFFVTRFREVLFHYSTLFDMFDINAPREDPERLMFEKEFYGREIMNVVACEGTVRVERPETYKQWQAKITRAGFRQLPLDQDLINMLRCKVRANYHQDFIIDVDGHWTDSREKD
ncbi:Scarecrow-like protein 14 [Bienertia sinuspersici]